MFKITLTRNPDFVGKFTDFHFISGTCTYKFTRYNPLIDKYDLIMTNGSSTTWRDHSTTLTIQNHIDKKEWFPLTEEEISKLNY